MYILIFNEDWVGVALFVEDVLNEFVVGNALANGLNHRLPDKVLQLLSVTNFVFALRPCVHHYRFSPNLPCDVNITLMDELRLVWQGYHAFDGAVGENLVRHADNRYMYQFVQPITFAHVFETKIFGFGHLRGPCGYVFEARLIVSKKVFFVFALLRLFVENRLQALDEYRCAFCN